MIRTLVSASICVAMASAALAEDKLVLSVVGQGQTAPEKFCVIGFEDGTFWATEQIAMNSFPAPRVALEPFEGRDQSFAELIQLLDGTGPGLSGGRETAPAPPYVKLVLSRGNSEGDIRREAYLAGLAMPPTVARLFGELGRYGMDCLPPVLR